MQNNSRNSIIAIVLCMLVVFAWQPVMNFFWPKPTPPPKLLKTDYALVTGSVTGMGLIARGDRAYVDARSKAQTLAEEARKAKEKEKEKDPVLAAMIGPKDEAIELIPLGQFGKDQSHIHALLNTYGASVQRVELTQFAEADRLGLKVTNPDGSSPPLPLIPGVKWKPTPTLGADRNVGRPDLPPGVYGPKDPRRWELLGEPSYVMYHYEAEDDQQPRDTLATRNWKVVAKNIGPDADPQSVTFETDLITVKSQTKKEINHSLRIRKTYTLKRNENHIGLRVEIERIGDKPVKPFRYQIAGAHGLPIEGEWYTSTFHLAITGFDDGRRAYQDAREVRHTEGGERITGGSSVIRYAAVAVQYFASALAVSDEQPSGKHDFIEYVRATPVGEHNTKFPFLDDVTVRAITKKLTATDPITHEYLLYQGPVKVRQLRQLEGTNAVPDELVDRYTKTLHLETLTDAPMPNALGRFANSIYWSDLVIAFTNLIHSLVYYLFQIIPNLGICILVVTVLVRGMLYPLSRRQAIHSQQMSQKMAKIAPELKKLQEKYAGDFQRMMQERSKLYRQHGISPLGALGGCLPLLIQMPIFMGLYYALQESVLFRLEPFLWMHNLAAPDMLVWWGESLPIISVPDGMGSPLYLGPFFNILPIVAVTLMIIAQRKMMPQTADPQMQAQMKMMKWMMILFGLFFYKVAAGLCMYFVASTLWGILERRYIPKLQKHDDPNAPPDASGQTAQLKPQAPDNGDAEPTGWWGRKKAAWRARWKEILEQAQKQAEYRNQPREESRQPDKPSPQRPGGSPQRKKKKKR